MNKPCEKCGRLVPEGRECPTCSGWGASEWFVFVATMAVTLGIIAVGWQPAKKAETVKSPNGGVVAVPADKIECYPGQVRPDGAEIDACVDGRWQKLISGDGTVSSGGGVNSVEQGKRKFERETGSPELDGHKGVEYFPCMLRSDNQTIMWVTDKSMCPQWGIDLAQAENHGKKTVKKAAKKIQTGAPRIENLTDWGINHDDERVSPITAQLKEIDHRCIGPFTPDGNMTFVDCPEQIIMIEGDKCRVVMVPKAEGKP